MKRYGSAKRLNEESLESYYWAGFIAADGHIQDGKRLIVALSIKDKNHLGKLSSFLGGVPVKEGESNGYPNCKLSIMDTQEIGKFSHKFNMDSNKTCIPVNFRNIQSKLKKIAFITGFIDGDGSIKRLHNRPDSNLVIKCHSSWREVLGDFSILISGVDKSKIDSRGYALLCVSDSGKLKQLKRITIGLNLPVLERKWNNIDLEYTGKQERYRENIIQYKRLKKEGMNDSTIANLLGVGKSSISQMKKRNKL